MMKYLGIIIVGCLWANNFRILHIWNDRVAELHALGGATVQLEEN